MKERITESIPNPAPRKVVHFFSSGSGYRWFLDQILTLKANGIDVECVIGHDGWLQNQLIANGVPTHVFDLSVPWSLGDLKDLPCRMQRMAGLLEFLRFKKYSAAQFHLFESSVIGRLSAWIVGIPIRIRMTETPAYMESIGAKKIELALQKLDTHTVASSELIRSQYIAAGLSSDAVSLIYYGASLKSLSCTPTNSTIPRAALFQSYGVPPAGPLISMVAHFYAERPPSDFTDSKYWGAPVKLHSLVIDAAKLVLQERPDAKFVLAGGAFTKADEDYRDRVREHARTNGLEQSVFFPGMVEDVSELLAASDLAVQCSSFDNLGGVLEAMAMSCPVIANDVGAFSEAIQHGQTGMLVDTTALSMSAAILHCLNNPHDTKEMGRRGQQLIEQQFSAERSASELSSLYKSAPATATTCQHPLTTILRAACLLPLYFKVVFLLCHRDIMSRRSHLSWQRIMRTLQHCHKRISDLITSIVVLLVTAPLALLAIPAILSSSTPMLFKYFVCGKGSRPIQIITWWPLGVTENNTLAPIDKGALPTNSRLQAAIALVRRKFWWLPLMFGVASGKMSIVGPCIRAFGFETSGQSWHICPPGIVGWTQSSEVASSEEAELRDSLYAVSFGPILDTKILCKAFFMSFRKPSRSGSFRKVSSELPSDAREPVG